MFQFLIRKLVPLLDTASEPAFSSRYAKFPASVSQAMISKLFQRGVGADRSQRLVGRED